MKEFWKDIHGYVGSYQISDMGRVKSSIRWNGTLERILRQSTKKDGHLHVCLYKNKKGKTHLVHALVLQTFIRPRQRGEECRHLDGNPRNNRLNNLRYGTHKENMEDCSRHGGFPDRRGSKNVRAKLTPDQVISIRKLYCNNALLSNRDKLSQLQIAKTFKVSEYTVWAIVNRKTWAHI